LRQVTQWAFSSSGNHVTHKAQKDVLSWCPKPQTYRRAKNRYGYILAKLDCQNCVKNDGLWNIKIQNTSNPKFGRKSNLPGFRARMWPGMEARNIHYQI
jgi:hypothetical protein